MKRKGIRTIVLLGVVALLLMALMAAIAAAGGGERGIDVGDFNWDARYWWEVPPLTPYEREQVKEIMVFIFDRYFGIDVSTMSPEEFEDLGRSIGPGREKDVLLLFEYYTEKRGFQMPPGIFEMPVDISVLEEFMPPAEVSYWWELVDPEYREARIAFFQEIFEERFERYPEEFPFAEVNVRNMTPEEFERALSPPLPPLRLLTIEEIKREGPAIIAVYGRPRSYTAQTEIREWLDRLREVQELFIQQVFPETPAPTRLFPINQIGIRYGFLVVGLCKEELTINEALALASHIYALVSEKADRLGVQDVPVVFSLIRRAVLDIAEPHQVAPPQTTRPPWVPPVGPAFVLPKISSYTGCGFDGDTLSADGSCNDRLRGYTANRLVA